MDNDTIIAAGPTIDSWADAVMRASRVGQHCTDYTERMKRAHEGMDLVAAVYADIVQKWNYVPDEGAADQITSVGTLFDESPN